MKSKLLAGLLGAGMALGTACGPRQSEGAPSLGLAPTTVESQYVDNTPIATMTVGGLNGAASGKPLRQQTSEDKQRALEEEIKTLRGMNQFGDKTATYLRGQLAERDKAIEALKAENESALEKAREEGRSEVLSGEWAKSYEKAMLNIQDGLAKLGGVDPNDLQAELAKKIRAVDMLKRRAEDPNWDPKEYYQAIDHLNNREDEVPLTDEQHIIIDRLKAEADAHGYDETDAKLDQLLRQKRLMEIASQGEGVDLSSTSATMKDAVGPRNDAYLRLLQQIKKLHEDRGY